MRILNYLLICFALVAGFSQTAAAQTAPLDEKQKAVLLFDVRLDRLQESELSKSMGLKEMMQQNSASSEIDFSKAIRIFGMMSAPESVQEIQEMQGAPGGDLPLEFSMRVQFADEGALNDVMNKAKTESTEFTQGGKTYYRPKSENENAPKNICMGQVDNTSLVMGTDAYVLLADQKLAFSDGLKASWGNVSKVDDSVRIVIDLVGAKTLIDEALEMGKEGAPPMAVGFMELVPTMNDLRITMDLSGGSLFTLGSTCKDSESATNLKDALDSIFGMAKLGGQAQLGQMKQVPGMEGVVEVGGKILDAMKPNVDGDTVSVTIPKPEGFEAAVQKAAGMFGMGGPAPGGPEVEGSSGDDSDAGGF